jgi:hypothetical protein
MTTEKTKKTKKTKKKAKGKKAEKKESQEEDLEEQKLEKANSEEKNSKKEKSEEETLVVDELKPEKKQGPPEKLFFGKSDRSLYVVIAFVALILLGFVIVLYLQKPEILSLDDYHDLNLKGDLDEEEGYLYNGFSFVKVRGTWYTRFKREEGGQIYNVETRYGPREVEEIPLVGDYNYLLTFNDTFITFNPNGKDFPHIALAAADMSLNLVRVFNITPHAACTEPHEKACKHREIMTCKQGVSVIYIKEDPKPAVSVEGTCITIQGTEFDLVKSANRLLFAWYGIM